MSALLWIALGCCLAQTAPSTMASSLPSSEPTTTSAESNATAAASAPVTRAQFKDPDMPVEAATRSGRPRIGELMLGSCLGAGAALVPVAACLGAIGLLPTGLLAGLMCGFSPAVGYCGAGSYILALLLISGANALGIPGIALVAGSCLGVTELLPVIGMLIGALFQAGLNQVDLGQVVLRALPGIAIAVMPLVVLLGIEGTMVIAAMNNQPAVHETVREYFLPVVGVAAAAGLLLGAPVAFVGINLFGE